MPIFDKPKGFAAKFLSKNPMNDGPFMQKKKKEEEILNMDPPDPDREDGGFETKEEYEAWLKDKDYDTYSQLNPDNPEKD